MWQSSTDVQPLMLQLFCVSHHWSHCNFEHKSWLFKKVVENRTSNGRRCISIGITSIFFFFFKCACYSCLSGLMVSWRDLLHTLGSGGGGGLHSVLSELEPLWLCWSAEAALAEVDTGLAFSLKSVIITVRSPTVTSRCRALLLSMFFNLGLTKNN